MLVGVVTEEVPTGLVVLQVKLVLQLDAPEAIVQSVAVSVPVMAVKLKVTVQFAVIAPVV